ncbi:MAG: hypothetical protein AAFY78_24270 [Cyanobacteria bacterium J06648_16]
MSDKIFHRLLLFPLIDCWRPALLTAAVLGAGLSPPSLASDPAAVTALSSEQPLRVELQGATLQNGADNTTSGRATVTYSFNEATFLGGTLEATRGTGLVNLDSDLSLHELYLTRSLIPDSTLTLTAGQLDLTSYFDRNSFAKDGTVHFANPTFQTNPALAAAGLESEPALLASWRPTDHLLTKVAVFSSGGVNNLSPDGVAAEVGWQSGTAIMRLTYVTGRDAGDNTSFEEAYGLARAGGALQSTDREHAVGLNAEWFMPESNVGLFARYGLYYHPALDRAAQTYSVGGSVGDVLVPGDRVGVAYGQALSNSRLRDARSDVAELFYDRSIAPGLRVGASLQSTDGFSDTQLGLRVRTNTDLLP